jgi:hypothetical protein
MRRIRVIRFLGVLGLAAMILGAFALSSEAKKTGIRKTLSNQQSEDETLYLVLAYIRAQGDKEKILGVPLDVWEITDQYILGRGTEEELATLRQLGIQLEEIPRIPYDGVPPEAGETGDYHSYDETCAELDQLQADFPSIAQSISLGQSVEGREICALKISDNVTEEEYEPEILFDGCHHAREWISVEVPLLLAKYLVENYGSDSSIQNLVDDSAIWIVPMVNPDGHVYSVDFSVDPLDPDDPRFWRKNRNDYPSACIGVDLNRNYGYQWGLDSGSSPDSCEDTYRGPDPFSESESVIMKRFASTHSFRTVVDYHNYSQLVLYPWGYTYDSAPDNALLDMLAVEMAGLMNAVYGTDYTPQAGSDLYLASGVSLDWYYGECGIPAFTTELRPAYLFQGGFILPEDQIQPTFEENLPAQEFLIDWARDREAADLSIMPWGHSRAPQESPSWQTGDIFVDNDLDGNVNEEGEPLIGVADNKLFARITNRGSIASGSYTVKFSFVPFTTNGEAGPEMLIEEVAQGPLGPGDTVEVEATWDLTSLPDEFAETDHFCVKVLILPQLVSGIQIQTADINRCNNFAQSNFVDVQKASGSEFGLNFYVRNDRQERVRSALIVSGLPRDWRVLFEGGVSDPSYFELAGGEERLVEATLYIGTFVSEAEMIDISQEIEGATVGGISIRISEKKKFPFATRVPINFLPPWYPLDPIPFVDAVDPDWIDMP